MTTQRTGRYSFGSGILTPELFGRIDFAKYVAGLAECENFDILPHGPAANSAGTTFVNEVKDSSRATRLIPFSFNAEQTFALEFGHQYIRFHTNGGTLLETVKNVTAVSLANPGVFTSNAHGYANGDWVYVLGMGGLRDANNRSPLNYKYFVVANVTANTYTLQDLNGNDISTVGLTAYTGGGTTGRVYTLATTYDEADLFDLHYVQSADVLTLVHPSYAPAELRRLGATNWTLTNISFNPTISAPSPTPTITTAGPGGGTPVQHVYVVTSIASGTLEESTATSPALASGTAITGATNANPGVITAVAHGLVADELIYISGVGGMTQLNNQYYYVNTVPTANTFTIKTLAGVVVNTTGYGVYTAGGTVQRAGGKIDLTVSGNVVNIAWTAVSGAVRYNVYKLRSGLYGYIGQTAGNSFTDDNIQADTENPPPEYQNPFGSAGNYPAAVTYYEQRRGFGGTTNSPQGVNLTRPGSESNFSYSIPTQDDDAISFTVKAREINRIRHMVPFGDLILLTNGAEWRVTSGDSFALTPTTIRVRPQGYSGASNVQPEVTSNSVLYVQAEGTHVRELTYDQNGNLRSSDISLLAAHLFDYYQITDLSYVKGPVPMLRAVRDDGTLLCMTYQPEQQVVAWSARTTEGGAFESVCTVTESNESTSYYIVQRTIDGNTKRYIERQHTRKFETLADAYFVDCGLSYDGNPTDEITGLDHLEGETVSILVDGAVHPQRVVSNGMVTLEVEGSKIHIGLPITSHIKTLPLALQVEGLGQGREKNIDRVWLRVYRSSGIFAGPSLDRLREVKQRTSEPYGTPPSLKTDELELVIDPAWTRDGAIYVRQTDPLPLTLLSMTYDVTLGG